MRILAHRGDTSTGRPENSWPAFRAAVDAAADGIETDVRVASDGSLVIHHDPLAPGGDPVASLTPAGLAAAVGHDIPDPAAALQAFPDILWNLEIKTPAAADAVRALVAAHGTDRVVVSSFDHPAAFRATRGTRARTGLLMSHRPLHADRLLDACLPEDGPAPCLVWNAEFADRALLERCRARGFTPWLYNLGVGDLERVRTWGVVAAAIVDGVGGAARAGGPGAIA